MLRWGLAGLLGLVGAGLLLGTPLLLPLAAVPMALGLALALPGSRWRIGVAVLALALGAALLLRPLGLDVREYTPALSSLAPGQYVARSDDPLHLVTARIVVREGGALIFAEAHALPFVGLDAETLRREPRRALFFQGLAPRPEPGADPMTLRLVRNALSHALSGDMPREDPVLPEGAWAVDGGGDTFWGMFPSEFDHRCEFSGVPDGQIVGRSSNPTYPATVRVTVAGGRPVRIEVLDGRYSEHGRPAFEQLPARMVASGTPEVDIISGAPRSSLILKSAVFHACRAAGGAVPPRTSGP